MWFWSRKSCQNCKDLTYDNAGFQIAIEDLKRQKADVQKELDSYKSLGTWNELQTLKKKDDLLHGPHWDASEYYKEDTEDPSMPDRKPVQDFFPSDGCFDIVKHFEHFYPEAYYCPAGILTIGYGHTSAQGPPIVREDMEITEEYAGEILINDLEISNHFVKKLVRVPLFQREFDSLVSWVFNLGPGNLERSTMLKRINERRFNEVGSEMRKWNKSNGEILFGLVRRRKSEAHLFDTGEVNFFEES